MSSVILKTLSVGPAGLRTHDLPHGSPVLNQLSQPVGGVKPKQVGFLDMSALLLPKKVQAFRRILYYLGHVHIPRKVASNSDTK